MAGEDKPYRLDMARWAARSIAEELPEPVAAACLEFITGDLLRWPRRVGRPLRYEMVGRYSARRGTYRVIYTVDDAQGVVRVLLVQHRRDVYH